ncbi:hypothetical protein VTI74DRAFT_4056 [Chaetomium olivicolor]
MEGSLSGRQRNGRQLHDKQHSRSAMLSDLGGETHPQLVGAHALGILENEMRQTRLHSEHSADSETPILQNMHNRICQPQQSPEPSGSVPVLRVRIWPGHPRFTGRHRIRLPPDPTAEFRDVVLTRFFRASYERSAGQTALVGCTTTGVSGALRACRFPSVEGSPADAPHCTARPVGTRERPRDNSGRVASETEIRPGKRPKGGKHRNTSAFKWTRLQHDEVAATATAQATHAATNPPGPLAAAQNHHRAPGPLQAAGGRFASHWALVRAATLAIATPLCPPMAGFTIAKPLTSSCFNTFARRLTSWVDGGRRSGCDTSSPIIAPFPILLVG